jgi:hypothetical protein
MRGNCRAGSHRRRLLASVAGTLVAFSILATVGCATTSSTPKTVTDIKQLVGSWSGWMNCNGGLSRCLRATPLVRDDGTWTMPVERNPAYIGKVVSTGNVVRYTYGMGGPWRGTVTLVEENGRDYLTFVRENGEAWCEFDRAK